MKHINQSIVSITLFSIILSTPALAGGAGMPVEGGPAEQCYQQTVKASEGAPPSELKVVHCDRALIQRPPRKDIKAAILHNRGIVQMAKGQHDEARSDFERSVALSREVGVTHLALAQLAHKSGDYEQAVMLYDVILESGMQSEALATNRDIIENNRQIAFEAAQDTYVAQDAK